MNYEPPPHHWQGFGSQSTQPTWYDPYRWDKGRRPLNLWEGDACGAPRVVPKKPGKKAPYNHSDDDRSYRPEVSLDKYHITTMVPASKTDRQILDRDLSGFEGRDIRGSLRESGTIPKYQSYLRESNASKHHFSEIKAKNVKTEMKSIIFAAHNMDCYLPFSRTRSDFAVGKK